MRFYPRSFSNLLSNLKTGPGAVSIPGLKRISLSSNTLTPKNKKIRLVHSSKDSSDYSKSQFIRDFLAWDLPRLYYHNPHLAISLDFNKQKEKAESTVLTLVLTPDGKEQVVAIDLKDSLENDTILNALLQKVGLI